MRAAATRTTTKMKIPNPVPPLTDFLQVQLPLSAVDLKKINVDIEIIAYHFESLAAGANVRGSIELTSSIFEVVNGT